MNAMAQTRVGLLGFLAATTVFASQVSFQGMEADAPQISRLLLVKVGTIRRWQDHKVLKDGSQGPMTAVHLEATCEVQRVVKGPFEAKSVVVQHQMMSGTVYDDDGKPIITKSFVLPGSGLEQQLKEGGQYLLSLRAPNAGQLYELLLRADPPEAEKALTAAIDAARAAKPKP